MKNKLLEQTKAAILQKADPRLRPVIDKLVKAGETIMYSDRGRVMMANQIGKGDDPETVGAGIAKLIGIIYNESKKTAPMQAMIPAAVVLLCEGLQLIEDAGGPTVNNDFLSQCTMAMGSSVAQLFGATPDKLQGMLDKSGKTANVSPAQTPPPQAPPPAGGILSQGAM